MRIKTKAILLSLILIGTPAWAHHSLTGVYDKASPLQEIEGVITYIRWANPHIMYRMEVTGAEGQKVEWTIQSESINQIKRQGFDRDFIKEGERIRMAGYPSLRNRPELFALNVLLPNDTEVILDLAKQPFWPDAKRRGIVEQQVTEAERQEAIRTAGSIFRVWSPMGEMHRTEIQLTEIAAAAKSAWNPASNRRNDCLPPPMPTTIPGDDVRMEIRRRGDDIVIISEEFDAQRLILMSEASKAAVDPQTYSRYGTSIGHWQDERTLVIHTDRIEAAVSTFNGTPQSREMKVVERLVLSEDEQRLTYSAQVSDPRNLAEPYEQVMNWVWKPGVQRVGYDCDPESSRYLPPAAR